MAFQLVRSSVSGKGWVEERSSTSVNYIPILPFPMSRFYRVKMMTERMEGEMVGDANQKGG